MGGVVLSLLSLLGYTPPSSLLGMPASYTTLGMPYSLGYGCRAGLGTECQRSVIRSVL